MSRRTPLQHELPPVEVGSMWKSICGREVLRIERVWVYRWPDVGEALTVRGHPVRGGRPLVCPVDFLRAHYSEEPTR